MNNNKAHTPAFIVLINIFSIKDIFTKYISINNAPKMSI